jgi:serine protease Do
MNKKNIEEYHISVVRIYAENIGMDFRLPYMISDPSIALGSGTFIHEKGYILTCFHVVQNAKNVYIDMPYISSDKHLCEIISVCPSYDLALLKLKKNIKEKYVMPLSMETWNLEIGMKVYAIGYPVNMYVAGSGNTLKITTGIISGQHAGYIQTDTAINPGNSGGPLLYNNTIIGVNIMKLDEGKYDNIGYAVPIHRFLNLWGTMMDTKIVYPLELKIDYNRTTEDMLFALTYGKVKKGIELSWVSENSILSIMEKGDILMKINEYDIENDGNLQGHKWLGTEMHISMLLDMYKEKETISIVYYSLKKRKNINTKIVLHQKQDYIRMYYPMYEKIDYVITCGMIFMNLTINIIHQIQYKEVEKYNCYWIFKYLEKINNNEKCVIVVNIFPNSYVDQLGNIHLFCILSKVNHIHVHTVSDVKEALQKPIVVHKKKFVHMEERDGGSIILKLQDVIKEDKHLSEIYKYPYSKKKYSNSS